MSLRGDNNTPTSVTGASSDASGVTGDLTLDLKTGTDDNSTNGTRTLL